MDFKWGEQSNRKCRIQGEAKNIPGEESNLAENDRSHIGVQAHGADLLSSR